jgi:hypothetical protein
MRFTKVVSGIVAAAFVFGPLVLYVGGVRPRSIENRPLAAVPDPGRGWSAADQAGPWSTDHLPGRTQAVHANSWISYFVLHELPRQARITTASPAAVTSGAARVETPTVVLGKNGYLFYGDDFDAACENGREFRASLRRLAELARVIESSGRRAVFALGPNKSSVTADELPEALPRGACAARGIAAQNAVLDRVSDPHFVPMRRQLAREHAAGRQVYWKTDTHWTTAGGSLFARQLARKLSPALAGRLTTRPSTLRKNGDLMTLAGLTFKETGQAAKVHTGGVVRERATSSRFDPRHARYAVNRWDTSPATGLVPGKSLILGDSFSYFVLDALRPVFAHGTFTWLGHVSTHDLVDQIADSDTVVLEVVQRALVGRIISDASFRTKVAARLGVPSNP